jgi:hypothetical protein
MKVADLVVSWLIVFMGVLHATDAPRKFNTDSLWFLSGSLSLFLAASINLLRSRYAAVAPWLRFFCVVMNLVLAGFAFALGKAEGHITSPAGIVMLLFLAAAVLSLRRGGPKHEPHKPAPPPTVTSPPPVSATPGK